MPSFWRTLLVVDEVTKNWGEELTVSDLLTCYLLKISEVGRVLFRSRLPTLKLVEEGKVNDKGWKTGYFYVKKASLGDLGDWLCTGWTSPDLKVQYPEAQSRILTKFLAIPIAQRTFGLAKPTCPSESSDMSTKSAASMSNEEMEAVLLKKRKTPARSGSTETPIHVEDEERPLATRLPTRGKGTPFKGASRTRGGTPSSLLPPSSSGINTSAEIEKLLLGPAPNCPKGTEMPELAVQGADLITQGLRTLLLIDGGIGSMIKVQSQLMEENSQLKGKLKAAAKDKEDALADLKSKFDVEYGLKVEELDGVIYDQRRQLEEDQKKIAELEEALKLVVAEATYRGRGRLGYEIIHLGGGDEAAKKAIDDYTRLIGSIEDLAPVTKATTSTADSGRQEDEGLNAEAGEGENPAEIATDGMDQD